MHTVEKLRRKEGVSACQLEEHRPEGDSYGLRGVIPWSA